MFDNTLSIACLFALLLRLVLSGLPNLCLEGARRWSSPPISLYVSHFAPTVGLCFDSHTFLDWSLLRLSLLYTHCTL